MNKLKFTEEESKRIFFTSDTHFQHENIIEYCNRPYQHLSEMNHALIDNWNEVVPPNGIVFHAGDFIFTGNIDVIKDIVDDLNGDIYLTLGNHDYQNKLDREVFKKIFKDVRDMYQITIMDSELEEKHINFIITHYPFLFWRRGYVHLHGHVHSGPLSSASEKVAYHPMRYDIGVDNNNFYPISYHQLKVILTKNSMK